MHYIISLLCLLLISCSNNSTTEQQTTLTIGTPADAMTLFPYATKDVPSLLVIANIFDRLVDMDQNGRIVPSLATSWEFNSPTVLRMSLRSNVQFHNGEIFSAKDVKFSIDHMMEHPTMAQTINPVKSVEIIDDYTIDIILHAPFAPILAHLAQSGASILNQKAIEEHADNVDRNPVGTGSYQFTSWAQGNSIQLDKFTNYWGESVHIPTLVFKVIGDDSSRTIALETGDVDMVLDVAPIDRNRLLDNPDFTLAEQVFSGTEHLGFNVTKEPWSNPKVRQAIAYAIDNQGIIESVLFNVAEPASSLLTKNTVGYSEIPLREQNYEKARQLLQEASFDPSHTLDIWVSGDIRSKAAEIIQENLRQIGINVAVKNFEWGRFIEGTSKGEHDAYILTWTIGTGDADRSLYPLAHSSSLGTGGNRAFYQNPEMDRLLEQARSELDSAIRTEIYKKAQDILNEDLPYIPMSHRIYPVGMKSNIKGFVYDPITVHRFRTVYFKE